VKKPLLVFFFFLLFIPAILRAAPDSARLAISIVPTNFFSQGLRFDLDKRIGLSKKWWTAFAQLYFGLTNKDGGDRTDSLKNLPISNYSGDQFTGLGLGLGYKIFPHYFKYRTISQYIQFGAEYQYFYMHYQEPSVSKDWYNTAIQRFIPMLVMGFQLNYKNVLLDGYFGDAYSLVSLHNNKPGLRDYSKGVFNFARRAALPLGGIRIGIFLR
jgi:hypothetical protein